MLYAIFSKFYGKVGVISWFLFHLIWKNYILYWDFDLKSWIVDFFTRFTREKTPQNNFSSQNFSVENNYLYLFCDLHLPTVNSHSCWLPTRFRPSFKHFLCLVNLALCSWPQLYFFYCSILLKRMIWCTLEGASNICRKIYQNFLMLYLLKEDSRLPTFRSKR